MSHVDNRFRWDHGREVACAKSRSPLPQSQLMNGIIDLGQARMCVGVLEWSAFSGFSCQRLEAYRRGGTIVDWHEYRLTYGRSTWSDSMTKGWEQYQIEARDLFRSLGLFAEVEESIKGVRGEHAVDVWVWGKILGFDVQWAVECKCWKTNVPKEKVLALKTLVEDVGADKGFLLSEIGFQSGAIRMARQSNIVLTSIEDLRENSQLPAVEAIVGKLFLRQRAVEKKLRLLNHSESGFNLAIPQARQTISYLPAAFDAAARGQYPIGYYLDWDDKELQAGSLEELVKGANRLIDEAEEVARKFLR
jgi:hypothetical protein